MKFDLDEYLVTALTGVLFIVSIPAVLISSIVMFPFWCVGVICKKLGITLMR